MSAQKCVNEPNVPCPAVFESPFLKAAGALDSQYDDLNKILRKIEELISQGKLEELRRAGEELQNEAKRRASNLSEDYRVSDSHFSFTTNRQTYRTYGQAERQPTWHTVPFLGEVTNEDIALYLAITGKSKESIPLRITQALDGKFGWNFLLSKIQEIGEAIPSIPEMVVKPPQIRIDNERRLILGGWNNDPAIELGVNWRSRSHPICAAVRESSEDGLWSKKSTETSLIRFEDKYIWISMEAPSKAALLCPGLIQLKEHFGEFAECLKLWQANLGTSNDSFTRLKRWLESKPDAAPWIAHIAEIILVDFSPWPDPYHLRPENDSARDWSPEQCLKQVLPLFRALSKAPLRSTPPNLISTFLYLIRRPNVDAHAWAGEFSEMWKFKVRTYDHSWINGEIVGESHSTFGSNSPLKFREIGGGYSGSVEGYGVSCGGIDCFISEEKNQRR